MAIVSINITKVQTLTPASHAHVSSTRKLNSHLCLRRRHFCRTIADLSYHPSFPNEGQWDVAPHHHIFLPTRISLSHRKEAPIFAGSGLHGRLFSWKQKC